MCTILIKNEEIVPANLWPTLTSCGQENTASLALNQRLIFSNTALSCKAFLTAETCYLDLSEQDCMNRFAEIIRFVIRWPKM